MTTTSWAWVAQSMPTHHTYASSWDANDSLPSGMVEDLDRPWCLITPVQALVARLPTGRTPRPTSSRRKSPLGDSRRLGPLGALDEAAEPLGAAAMVQGAAISVSLHITVNGPICHLPS